MHHDSVVSPLRALGRRLFPDPLSDRRTWLRVWLYTFFIMSTFTIAGIEGSTILLYLTVVYHRWREPVQERLPAWLLAALFAYPAIGLVSALANAFPHFWRDLGFNLYQWKEDYWRWFFSLALLPALGVASTRRLLQTYLAFTSLWALYALVQFRWGVDWFRPEGEKIVTHFGETGFYHAASNFTHHLTYVGIMLMNVPVFVAIARAERGRLRWVWGAGAALAALAVVASLARGGWAGAAVALVFLALGFPRRVLLPIFAAALPLALLGAALATGWLQAQLAHVPQNAVVQRILETSLTNDRERLYLWESGWIGIMERPWLGVGPNNHRFYLPAIREAISERTGFEYLVTGTVHVHNVFLQIAFNTGLLGLAAYLAWWFAVFRWSALSIRLAGGRYPLERALLAGCSSALVGSMVEGLFEYNFFDAEVQAATLMMMGLALHAGLAIRRGLRQSAA